MAGIVVPFRGSNGKQRLTGLGEATHRAVVLAMLADVVAATTEVGRTVVVTEGGEPDRTDATIRTSGEVFEQLVSGKQNPATAYMTGKVKVDGDLGAVLKLQKLFS